LGSLAATGDAVNASVFQVLTQRKYQQALRVVQNCVGNCIRRDASNAIENCFCTPERRRARRGLFRGAPVAGASENQKQRERDENARADTGQGGPPSFLTVFVQRGLPSLNRKGAALAQQQSTCRE